MIIDMASSTQDFLERNMLQIAVIAVGGYMLWKLFGVKKGVEAAQAAEIDRDIAQMGIRTSYTLTEYTSLADRLYEAMFDTGTDEDEVYAVMQQMMNDADVYATIKAFGSRRAPLGDSLSGAVFWTLPVYIRKDMSDDEVTNVNTILDSKGIRFKF